MQIPLHTTHRRPHQRGFSIVETLIYIALFTTVSIASVTTILTLDDLFIKNRVDRTLSNSAEVALEAMTREIRDAFAVDVLNSTLGTSPGVLEIQAGTSTTIFSVNGGKVHAARNGVSPGPLTSGDVTIDSLIFYHYLNIESEAVRIALTLSAAESGITITRTYYSTAVLRRSYD
jgi:type II secretory pathway pseudopilin PulG